jgi:hypothetical protein
MSADRHIPVDGDPSEGGIHTARTARRGLERCHGLVEGLGEIRVALGLVLESQYQSLLRPLRQRILIGSGFLQRSVEGGVTSQPAGDGVMNPLHGQIGGMVELLVGTAPDASGLAKSPSEYARHCDFDAGHESPSPTVLGE